MCRHAPIADDEAYPAGPEPMYRPDLRAKPHPRPEKRLRIAKRNKPLRVVVDHELVLLEISRMQRAAGVL